MYEEHFLGNPNEKPTETFIWENFVGTERWNELGINNFASYGIEDDQRKARCGMLDEIQHYMLHWNKFYSFIILAFKLLNLFEQISYKS